MDDKPQVMKPAMPLWQKIGVGIISVIFAGGGVTGGATYFQGDKDRANVDTRLAVIEVVQQRQEVDTREARRELRSDLLERINEVVRRMESLERRMVRWPGPGLMPAPARPMIDGDANVP